MFPPLKGTGNGGPAETQERHTHRRPIAADLRSGDAPRGTRCNVTQEQRAYLIGMLYREMKREQGGDRGNQYTAPSSQNGNMLRTAEVIVEHRLHADPGPAPRRGPVRCRRHMPVTCRDAAYSRVMNEL